MCVGAQQIEVPTGLSNAIAPLREAASDPGFAGPSDRFLLLLALCLPAEATFPLVCLTCL